MNRRLAVKNLVVATGSLITLPAWMRALGADNLTHFSTFTTSEQQLLASIIDTVIPAGNAIGALSVGVDKYFQKLVDECYEKSDQDKVKSGLLKLDEAAKIANSQSFISCSPGQRQALLEKWSASTDKTEKDFCNLVKSETIRGYNTSQEVMEGYLNYKVAPGHYYGCINVKA